MTPKWLVRGSSEVDFGNIFLYLGRIFDTMVDNCPKSEKKKSFRKKNRSCGCCDDLLVRGFG